MWGFTVFRVGIFGGGRRVQVQGLGITTVIRAGARLPALLRASVGGEREPLHGLAAIRSHLCGYLGQQVGRVRVSGEIPTCDSQFGLLPCSGREKENIRKAAWVDCVGVDGFECRVSGPRLTGCFSIDLMADRRETRAAECLEPGKGEGSNANSRTRHFLLVTYKSTNSTSYEAEAREAPKKSVFLRNPKKPLNPKP